MKWVTYRSDDGERAGVLSGDTIYALPPGSALLDLLGGAPTGCARPARPRCGHRLPSSVSPTCR
ncbi:bifunctional 2-hydroxyhepta-2,4-diene-1,7-dioate isomerase/cyclase/dehydrase domain protein [Mycobacterium kansasii 824]|nr:bifunctional 2-hydroxyhepta-2,4-diene-1,7-dioate isomerase/cyclase/dehydrase domain protein [Mycobacterium kansasii 824]